MWFAFIAAIRHKVRTDYCTRATVPFDQLTRSHPFHLPTRVDDFRPCNRDLGDAVDAVMRPTSLSSTRITVLLLLLLALFAPTIPPSILPVASPFDLYNHPSETIHHASHMARAEKQPFRFPNSPMQPGIIDQGRCNGIAEVACKASRFVSRHWY
jgi:hypothetical protein